MTCVSELMCVCQWVRVHTVRDRILFLKSWAVSHFYPGPILQSKDERKRARDSSSTVHFPLSYIKAHCKQMEFNALLSEFNATAQEGLQALEQHNTWLNPHKQCVWPPTSSATMKTETKVTNKMGCCEHGWLEKMR